MKEKKLREADGQRTEKEAEEQGFETLKVS